MRERAVLHPREEDLVELEPLGGVKRDQEDALLLVDLVRVGPEGHGVEKARDRRVVPLAAVRGGPLVLAGGREELVEVLAPGLVLRVEGVLVELREARLLQRKRHRGAGAGALRRPEVREALHERRGTRSRAFRARSVIPEGSASSAARSETSFSAACASSASSVAAPTPRAGTFTTRRNDTSSAGFRARRRYARSVLDLGPFVEFRPADEEVREVRAQELVLEGPGLGVRPEEDRHLALRTRAARRRDPRDDLPRLVPLLVERDEADLLAARLRGPERLAEAPPVLGDDRARPPSRIGAVER